MLQCRDIDALMMDWLYGELDPQNAQHFSTHVEDCTRCHSELAAYERTRELVSELPSEEPSPALSALLIREAASRAPTPSKAESAGGGGILAWLSRLFQPLQHPALAAVATLVLVAGVAGTLYLRDGEDHFAEPEASSGVAADDGFEAKTEPAPAPETEKALEESADQPAPAETATLATPADTDKLDSTVADAKDRSEKDANRRTDLLESKQKKKVARDLLKKEERRKRGKKPPSKNMFRDGVKANAISGGDPLLLDEEAPGFSSGSGSKAGPANRPYRAYRDRPDAWIESQQLRITEAYNRNDCRTAAKIANDILDRSPELYTKKTKKLEAVQRCKVYVQRERSKRAVARKKRGTSSSKAAGKAKRAPKSAPAPDLEQAVE